MPKLDRPVAAGVSDLSESVVSLALSTMGGAGAGVVRVLDGGAGDGARAAVFSLVGFQGARDRRPAPRARCASPTGLAPRAAARRPCFPGRGEPAAPQDTVALVLRDPGHAARVAPPARRPALDVSGAASRAAQGQPGGSRAGAAARSGEPAVGIPADRRRATRSRDPRLPYEHP